MPFFNDRFTDELLAYIGWIQTSEGWSHLKYQSPPGPKPDLHSPSSFWWILDWLVIEGYIIKFLGGINPKARHFRYCIAKREGKKWSIRDYPASKPHLALLGLILKVKRFPNGMPMKKEEYLAALSKKQIPKAKNLEERLRAIRDKTRKGSEGS